MLTGTLTVPDLRAVELELRRVGEMVEGLARDVSPGQPMSASDVADYRERLKDLKALIRSRADDPEANYADSLFRLTAYLALVGKARLSAATNPRSGAWNGGLEVIRAEIVHHVGRVKDAISKLEKAEA